MARKEGSHNHNGSMRRGEVSKDRLVLKYICPLVVAAYRAESGEPSTYWTYVEWTEASPPRLSFPLTATEKQKKKKTIH